MERRKTPNQDLKFLDASQWSYFVLISAQIGLSGEGLTQVNHTSIMLQSLYYQLDSIFIFPIWEKKNHSYSDVICLNSLLHRQNLLHFYHQHAYQYMLTDCNKSFSGKQLMRFDHKVILEDCYLIILCSSYYIPEPFRRTESNKTAVKEDQIAVVNISGVKGTEGKELLKLKSSVDAGTYGYSLSADKFQLEMRSQFSNSEI